MKSIIGVSRSIVPACDFDSIEVFERLVRETSDLSKVGAYKIGFELGLKFGLSKVVNVCRKYSDKPIIYDHQKAGTDVPFTGERFAKVCVDSGVDAVILFPQAGPETEKSWISACLNAGLGVIVGGEMTHPAYLASDGGFLLDDAPIRMYDIAIELGVSDFVVPGNKPEKILKYKEFFEERGVRPVLYSPGLVAQGGELTESGKVAGDYWHAIVGRGIYAASNIRKAVEEFCSKI